jgi:ATP-binding cassette subfamily B protein
MDKIKKTKALKNNVYALKLLGKICPSAVFNNGFSQLLNYFGWLFYSAFFMRYVINALQNGSGFWEIMKFLGITVIVFASVGFYQVYLESSFYPKAHAKINKGLYTILFKKARNVELECFENSDFYDKYTLAMEKADDRLNNTVSDLLGTFFGGIASVLAFVFMYQVDRLSVLFILFPIIGNFVFNRFISKIDYKRNKDMTPYNRKISYINRVMYLAEYAKEMRITNVFNLMRKQYQESIKGVSDVTGKYAKKAAALHWFYVEFTFTFIFEGLLIYGAYRTLVGHSMSLAQLSVITSMMVSTTWILIGFTDSLNKCFKNGLFIDYLKSFLEYKEKIPEDYKGLECPKEIESIEFRNVSFAYKDEMVLKNLNMEFRKDKTYALVGHNGAGKTTITKLLLRFYDPTDGQILLNGRNIKDYNLQQYRKLFATAFQDNKLLSMSVKDNVLMGEEVSESKKNELVSKALKLSGVYDKIMTLPQGLETTLTREFDDKGVVLSGGEFQKVVVARAFIRESPVKIFDEPSSALDPIAEYELFDNILTSCKNHTLLFISHRLSSVQNADWVYLLENGTVKEEGNHKKLMAMNGTYADMYNKQAKNYLWKEDDVKKKSSKKEAK